LIKKFCFRMCWRVKNIHCCRVKNRHCCRMIGVFMVLVLWVWVWNFGWIRKRKNWDCWS
jgi:hypothetical protein